MLGHDFIQAEHANSNFDGWFKVCKRCGLWVDDNHIVIPRALSILEEHQPCESFFINASRIICDNYKKASLNALNELSHLSHSWRKDTPSVMLICAVCNLTLLRDELNWFHYYYNHKSNTIKSCNEIIMEKVLM